MATLGNDYPMILNMPHNLILYVSEKALYYIIINSASNKQLFSAKAQLIRHWTKTNATFMIVRK